jgi:hypothetical protein
MKSGSRFGRLWWARQDSNLGPMDYESTALTAELRARAIHESTISGRAQMWCPDQPGHGAHLRGGSPQPELCFGIASAEVLVRDRDCQLY